MTSPAKLRYALKCSRKSGLLVTQPLSREPAYAICPRCKAQVGKGKDMCRLVIKVFK